jgi:hypothetical protein
VSDDQAETRTKFADAVNMTAPQLQDWLGTEQSREVGQKSGGSDESTGHEMGRRIVHLLQTEEADLTDADHEHMEKVVGYVHRHLAQRPSGDVTDTRWRWSLMNWGHDPLK